MSRRPGFRAVAACAFESWDGRPSKAEVDGLDRIETRLAFDNEDAEVHVYGRLEGGMPWARVVANGRMTAGGRPERVLYDGPWAGLLPPPSSEGSDARGAEPGRPWQSLRRYDCDGRTGEVTAERDGEFCYFDDVKALLGRLSCPPPAGPASPLPAAEIGPQAGSREPGIEVREIFGGWRFTFDSQAAGFGGAWSLPYATERAARAGAREALAGRFRLEAERQKAAELAAEVERLEGDLSIARMVSQSRAEGITDQANAKIFALAEEVRRLADKLAAAAAHFAGVESPYPHHGRCREMALASAVAQALLTRLGLIEKE